MGRRLRYARVDERPRAELRPRLARGAFEGEMGERGGVGVRGEAAVERVGGGVVDCCEDEVARLGDVLPEGVVNVGVGGGRDEEEQGTLTRPRPLDSIQAAFLRGLVARVPGCVAVIVEGRVWWRPGPMVRGLLARMGRLEGEMSSPGRRTSAGIV